MKQKAYHTAPLNSFTFLVTGGAGFIGSHLAEYLLVHGAKKVVVLDNFSTGLRSNINNIQHMPGFRLIEGDIRDEQTCRQAMEGIDYVLHQAALGSVPRSITDPVSTNQVNVDGFLNILVAARDAGVKRLVYAASSSTYGDSASLPKVEDVIGKPLSPYAVTKLVNELYAEVFANTYHLQAVSLRYFNVFGPRQNPSGSYAAVIPAFMKAALTGTPPVINGDGETSRDFTYIDNVVKANILALFSTITAKHDVFNVACGEQTTLNRLWQLISQSAGINVTPIYQSERKGDVRHSLASIAKAKQLLGYEPEVPVGQGLTETLKWYQSNLTHDQP